LAQGLVGEEGQVGGPGQSQGVIGKRYRKQQRRDAKYGGQHVDQERDGDTGQRDQARRSALADGARDQIDHVGAGRQHQAEGQGCEGKQGRGGGHQAPGGRYFSWQRPDRLSWP